jgi:hypothetical protein
VREESLLRLSICVQLMSRLSRLSRCFMFSIAQNLQSRCVKAVKLTRPRPMPRLFIFVRLQLRLDRLGNLASGDSSSVESWVTNHSSLQPYLFCHFYTFIFSSVLF